MAPNPNNQSIDKMLKELEKLFITNYLGYKKHNEPYEAIIEKLKPFKNARKKKDLLIAIENKFDSKESFLNLEANIWNILFVIIGLFVTMISDLILNNYDKLEYFNQIPRYYYIICVILIALILVLLYCISTYSVRKKGKEKCFYKFVYNYLNQRD